MRKQEEVNLFFNTNFLFLALFMAALTFSTGFTDEKTTSAPEATLVVIYESNTYGDESGDKPLAVEKETTVDGDDENRGILSTTLDVTGDIISLPLRLVAGLLRAIF